MDALASEHFAGTATAEGDTFILSEPSDALFPNEGVALCALEQAHFQASLFKEVRVVTLDVERRTFVDHVRFSLPSKADVPTACEKPPEGLYLR